MKFDCAIDKVYEIIKNIVLPFVFLYFCIWHFLISTWLFLNLLHDSICGTKSSRTVCETEYKKTQ